MLRVAAEIKGYDIIAKDGDIGSVTDLYFDDERWTVRYIIADTGDWIIGRKVLLSPFAVVAVDWSEHQVAVSLTRDQVQNAPSIDEDAPVSRKYERSYMGHYGWPAYWGGMFAWGAWPVPFLPDDRPRAEGGDSVEEPDEGDTHLRSVKEVTGYHIQATDEGIGHVENFILDDESWELRYLVVDTSNWWFGKKVLIAPAWVTSVDWLDRKVQVNLSRTQIKEAPEFDPSVPISRAYEERLYEFYGRPAYWT